MAFALCGSAQGSGTRQLMADPAVGRSGLADLLRAEVGGAVGMAAETWDLLYRRLSIPKRASFFCKGAGGSALGRFASARSSRLSSLYRVARRSQAWRPGAIV